VRNSAPVPYPSHEIEGEVTAVKCHKPGRDEHGHEDAFALEQGVHARQMSGHEVLENAHHLLDAHHLRQVELTHGRATYGPIHHAAHAMEGVADVYIHQQRGGYEGHALAIPHLRVHSSVPQQHSPQVLLARAALMPEVSVGGEGAPDIPAVVGVGVVIGRGNSIRESREE